MLIANTACQDDALQVKINTKDKEGNAVVKASFSRIFKNVTRKRRSFNLFEKLITKLHQHQRVEGVEVEPRRCQKIVLVDDGLGKVNVWRIENLERNESTLRRKKLRCTGNQFYDSMVIATSFYTVTQRQKGVITHNSSLDDHLA